MTEAVPFHKKLHTLTIEEFGEQYPSIIAAVFEQDGKAILIDGDKPVVQITRYKEVHDPLRGSLKGKTEIHGDIVFLRCRPSGTAATMTRKIWFDPAGYLRSALVPRVEPAPRLDSPTENTRSDRIRARSFLGYISLGVDLLLAKGRLTLGVTAHQWRQNLLTAGLIEIPVDGAQLPPAPSP